MKSTWIKSTIICIFIAGVYSCKKPDYEPDYKNATGYVIGKEICNTNEANDYWLVDLTYMAETPQYGDTLLLQGRTYTNVIKTNGLNERLKQIGMTVSLDFKTITANKVLAAGCTLSNSVIYNLKELFIINQFEIR
jgi:hypothetical protein